MRTLKFFFITVFVLVLSTNSFSQINDLTKMAVTKNENIKVFGNCKMCKTRIENAAKFEGIIKATWSTKTKILTLVYDPLKVKSDDVQKRIAGVGHDTENFKSVDTVYNSLPSCCKYERIN